MSTKESILKDRVVAELRRKCIKLWLPPYYFESSCDDGTHHTNGGRKLVALKNLAVEYQRQRQIDLKLPQESSLLEPCNNDKDKDKESAKSNFYNVDDVFETLRKVQDHALDKLSKRKRNDRIKFDRKKVSEEENVPLLELRVLGLQKQVEGQSVEKEAETRFFPKEWAQNIEVVNSNMIIFHNLSPCLGIVSFEEGLRKSLNVPEIRLIYKGKSLSSFLNCDDELLVKRLRRNNNEKSIKKSLNSEKVVILCLASHAKINKDDKFQLINNDKVNSKGNIMSSEESLIQSIRQAAAQIQSSARFEITDQNGRNVSMSLADRLAFLTALGLHRLGRKKIEEDPSSPTGSTSALRFLLEADAEWERLREWQERVDNYALLQIDIAWACLRLESLESLPGCIQRLELAEVVLRKQVNSNFVTLAIVQAEMGNHVPALAALFTRLFLLQGVGYRYCTDSVVRSAKSKERLDWAWVLCQALRLASPVQSVEKLCDVLGVSEFAAVSALRRANGNIDAAVDMLEKDKGDSEREGKRREQQRQMGLCQNEQDHVDIDLIPKLQSILDLNASFGEEGKHEGDLLAFLPQNQSHQNYHANAVVVGLLRLADNDIEKAIDIYQDMSRNGNTVLSRVSTLDTRLQEKGATPFSRKKRKKDKAHAVDDMALVTLISMGVDEVLGRKALRESHNDVELALLWLIKTEENGNSNLKEIAENDTPARLKDDSTNQCDKSETSSVTTETSASKEIGEKDATPGKNDTSEVSSIMTETNISDELRRQVEEDAEELLEKELGQVLKEGDMEKEYLGNNLDEEWQFIEKYRRG
mmetsp:Transcript_60415/g.71794  ORF Transcript_60415/g.71794 Transcript_60415/m.71794 type:complete len:814 (-) Transcript_60415:253-2694(-)|eukprot:CAMPEP_0172514074 /NCGR_PEP_ID=MMETSP1066-20121228/257378_1 /TAXON_ID=671091 /ORGANISM="Coscinodiscus wailesii, Strain CCMP2513" /LENGTH=813 /DNA_ID=CAMNT_0013294597 /DNA_START=130 /DNA_END=2571 /DNA_ORIENTATION=-